MQYCCLSVSHPCPQGRQAPKSIVLVSFRKSPCSTIFLLAGVGCIKGRTPTLYMKIPNIRIVLRCNMIIAWCLMVQGRILRHTGSCTSVNCITRNFSNTLYALSHSNLLVALEIYTAEQKSTFSTVRSGYSVTYICGVKTSPDLSAPLSPTPNIPSKRDLLPLSPQPFTLPHLGTSKYRIQLRGLFELEILIVLVVLVLSE